MLNVDGEKQRAWAREVTREKSAELRARALAEDLQSNQVTVAPDNGADVTDAVAQMGRPMTSEAVIAKLKQCNSHLRFERSNNYPDMIGIYLLDPAGRHSINGEKVTHVMGMESSTMPEFTIIRKMKKRVPDNDGQWKEIETYVGQTRGWRTILVRLLHAGFINRYDVEKHFGWTPSRQSANWYNRTQ